MRKLLFFLLLLAVLVQGAWAATDPRNNNAANRKPMEEFTETNVFSGTDGKKLYEINCQNCHMAEGKGVHTGVGMYPALANNTSAAIPAYTAGIIMQGLRGMPSYSGDFTDAQVTAIANYVATSFGNKAEDRVTEKEVSAMRPKTEVSYE